MKQEKQVHSQNGKKKKDEKREFYRHLTNCYIGK